VSVGDDMLNRFLASLGVRVGGRSPYLLGAGQASGAYAGMAFSRAFGFSGLKAHDGSYMTLEEGKCHAFVRRYFDPELVGEPYHGLGPEFPDCDDFAAIAFGAVLRGAVKERFPYPPLFGIADVRRPGGVPHQLNWNLSSSGKLEFFEPQVGEWIGAGDVGAVLEAWV
jgi:hypothetical protein